MNHALTLWLLVTLALWFWPPITFASEHKARPSQKTVNPHGVILLFHRVSDSGPDSTRVSPARFGEHLDQLSADGYSVVPLKQLLDGIYDNRPLPEKPIAITFDDAYQSVAETAYPMLRARQMPFTVFVASGVIDNEASAFSSWSALTKLAQDPLVSFGGHSVNHPHMELLPVDNTGSEETSRREEIDVNMARLREKLGRSVINAFAYPYGEFSAATEALLKARNLYGMAQQSGAVDATVTQTRIPRFPLYHGRDDRQRLFRVLTTRPLPVVSESPEAIVIPVNSETPPTWRFQWGQGPFNAKQIACYAATGAALPTALEDGWATVTLPVFNVGRNKVNCTAPSTDDRSRYFWYARMWLKIGANGLSD